jgi:hypothetical protein
MAAATSSALERFVCADSSERYEVSSAASLARARYSISSIASSSRLDILLSELWFVVQEFIIFLAGAGFSLVRIGDLPWKFAEHGFHATTLTVFNITSRLHTSISLTTVVCLLPYLLPLSMQYRIYPRQALAADPAHSNQNPCQAIWVPRLFNTSLSSSPV